MNLLRVTREQGGAKRVQERQHRGPVVLGVMYTLQLIPWTVNPVPSNRDGKNTYRCKTAQAGDTRGLCAVRWRDFRAAVA